MRWSVFKIGVNKPHSLDRDDVFGGRAPWIAASRTETASAPLGSQTPVPELPDVLVALRPDCEWSRSAGRAGPSDRHLHLVLLCVPPGGRLRLELANYLRIAQCGHVAEVMALGNVPE